MTFASLGGLPDTEATRRFSETIARHYGRPALPDDLGRALHKLRIRVVERYRRHSPEGSAVTALHEIRVRARPDWESPRVTVLLYFIVPEGIVTGIDGTILDAAAWDAWVKKWEALFEPTGTIQECLAIPVTYAELDALSYRSSDPLDLEYLSTT
jgi:hypothetical protein